MNGFSGLSYGQIENIADNLNTKSSSMESILNNISAQLKKVGSDDTWSGTAASSAFEEFNKLMQKFPEFSRAVKDCSTYLHKVVATYQSVDSSVTGQH